MARNNHLPSLLDYDIYTSTQYNCLSAQQQRYYTNRTERTPTPQLALSKLLLSHSADTKPVYPPLIDADGFAVLIP